MSFIIDAVNKKKNEKKNIDYNLNFIYRSIGQVGRVFANCPGDLGSIPLGVIPKTLKMVLDTSLLNTQQYKVRIKGKVEPSRERSSALLLLGVVVTLCRWSAKQMIPLFWRETKQRPEPAISSWPEVGRERQSESWTKELREAVGEGWRKWPVDTGQQKWPVGMSESSISERRPVKMSWHS